MPPKDTQPVLEKVWNSRRPLLPLAFSSACTQHQHQHQ
jgi:hypothetical protein